MSHRPPSQLEILKDFNLWLRGQLALAETRVPKLNDQIEQLARMGLLENETLLGDVIYTRPYTDPQATDGSLLIQAALLVPGGIGLVEWDRDHYLETYRSPLPMESGARVRFRPFDVLEPALKALLLPQVEVLLSRLLSLALPKEPAPPPALTGWTTTSA